MSYADLVVFALKALTGHRLRTALSMVGVSIGVAAVIVLTALGEGARRYVTEQFASLGSNLVIVIPGKTETSGALPGMGGAAHDLTVEDAITVRRMMPEVRAVVPISMGTEFVSHGDRRRQVPIAGTINEFLETRELHVLHGEFLPKGEWDRGAPIVVLGNKLGHELFPGEDPVGQVVRVGDARLRVIGVLDKAGSHMGMNADEIAYVPVATGLSLFNRASLFRIILKAGAHTDIEPTKKRVIAILTERHNEEDVTVLTQDAVIATFSSILTVLTLAISGIAAISLSVAGIGIMNVMLVSVSERTSEIGLLKALGAHRRQILAAFLTEAVALSAAGGVVGLVIGAAVVRLAVRLYPTLPASPPWWAVAAAMVVAVAVGAIFGVLPARRATRLDAVAALGRR